MHRCFVSKDDILGNGLFSSCDLEEFSVVVRELPVVSCLTKKALSKYCSYCWKSPSDKLRVCTRCRCSKYCSVSCQRKDWNFSLHKAECNVMSRMSENKEPTDMLRLCLRLVSRMNHQKECDKDKQSAFDNERFDSFALDSSCDSIEYYQQLSFLISKHLKDVYPTLKVSENEVMKVLLVLRTNVMRIPKGEDGSELGVGLFNVSSLTNNHCEPNCVIMFAGNALEMVTVKPIKKGEQLFISYVDNRIPRSLRRFMLFDHWNFVCGCSKCSEEKNYGDFGTLFDLYKSIGDSESFCTDEKKEKYLSFCQSHEEQHEKDQRFDAKGVIEHASKCAQLSATSNYPAFRFSELMYSFIKDKITSGYFFECVLHRFALNCVAINPSIKNEAELRSNLKLCFDLNESFVEQVKETNERLPFFLGKYLAMAKCLLWELSYQMEFEPSKVDMSKMDGLMKTTQNLFSKFFRDTKHLYAIQNDFSDVKDQYEEAQKAYYHASKK